MPTASLNATYTQTHHKTQCTDIPEARQLTLNVFTAPLPAYVDILALVCMCMCVCAYTHTYAILRLAKQKWRTTETWHSQLEMHCHTSGTEENAAYHRSCSPHEHWKCILKPVSGDEHMHHTSVLSCVMQSGNPLPRHTPQHLSGSFL